MKFISIKDGNGNQKPANPPKPICQNPPVAGNCVGCRQVWNYKLKPALGYRWVQYQSNIWHVFANSQLFKLFFNVILIGKIFKSKIYLYTFYNFD